jgi:hypothetical protein
MPAAAVKVLTASITAGDKSRNASVNAPQLGPRHAPLPAGVKRYATLFEGTVLFPNWCPFTGKPNPDGQICVHRSSDRVTPIPFIGLWHSFSRVELRVPADKGFCRQVRLLDVVMAIFLLLGPCIAAPWIVIRMMSVETKPIAMLAVLFFSSIAIAIICASIRFYRVRHFTIVDHFDGRIKVCFRSEEYANDFARLNRCALD